MKPKPLKQLIQDKRNWTEPLSPADKAQGFKGWYSSKHLPHFDAPGTWQFITYIENNPNKGGLVRAPADWPWSSVRYRGEPGPVVPQLTHPNADRTPPPTTV